MSQPSQPTAVATDLEMDAQPSPASAPDRLEDVVAEVAHNARQRADAYLEDTRVPEGGE